jgi:hypothetical protein
VPGLVAMGQGDHGRFAGGDGRAGQVIHYPTDVQPIFDAKCHGASESAGGLRLTGKLTLFYNTFYEELGKRRG